MPVLILYIASLSDCWPCWTSWTIRRCSCSAEQRCWGTTPEAIPGIARQRTRPVPETPISWSTTWIITMAVSSGSSTNNYRNTLPSTPVTNGRRTRNVLRTRISLCTHSVPHTGYSLCTRKGLRSYNNGLRTWNSNRITLPNTRGRNRTLKTDTSLESTTNRTREYWADRRTSTMTCLRFTTYNWTVRGRRWWSFHRRSITAALRIRSRTSRFHPTTTAAVVEIGKRKELKWFFPIEPARAVSGPTWTSTVTTRACTTPRVRSSSSTTVPQTAVDRPPSDFLSGGRSKTSACSATGCPTKDDPSFSSPGLQSDLVIKVVQYAWYNGEVWLNASPRYQQCLTTIWYL